MRVLVDDRPVGDPYSPGRVLTDDELATLYAEPVSRAVRAAFVTTVDGAVAGSTGRSGSINTASDFAVFSLVRALSDATMVGAGTARTEGYGAVTTDPRWRETRSTYGLDDPYITVVVSRSGDVPSTLAPSPDVVRLITCSAAPGLARARDTLGAAHVLVHGSDEVSLTDAVQDLAERGLGRLHLEGGPHLMGAMLSGGLVDELDLSTSPLLVGGHAARLAIGPQLQAPVRLLTLIEEDGTLLARWVTGQRER